MTFLRGLLAGRSHLAFLVGLAAAIAVVRLVNRTASPPAPPAPDAALDGPEGDLPLRAPGPLDDRERALARAAWAYFERNTDPATGLTASVAGYPSATLWEIAEELMAVLSAEDLGLVPAAGAEGRLGAALASLEAMPLCDGLLPNKAYDTATLAMVDYDDRPAPAGIGWSALDVAHVFVPLTLVLLRHGELAPAVRRLVARWRLDALAAGGALRGATRRSDGTLDTYQEGRLGYEQYAAKALLPFGAPVGAALDYRAHEAIVLVDGVAVPSDDRRPRDHGGAHAAVLSEPWILEGLEHGLDAVTLPRARAVLRAQRRRFERTGRLTAVSEDAIDRPPGFAYSAVLNGGDSWTAFWPDGTPAPRDLGFSAKAALGWAVLFDGDYPDRLLEAVMGLVAPGEGIYAGRYDATGAPNRALSLNTNAVVLEALAYRVRGPALRDGAARTAPAAGGGAPPIVRARKGAR